MDIDWFFDLPELIAFCVLVLGFFLALFSSNLFILYAVCFLAGLLFGRVWWKFKTANKLPVFLSVIGFLLGFILGSLFANLRLIILLMFGGMVIGYFVHEKNLLNVWS